MGLIGIYGFWKLERFRLSYLFFGVGLLAQAVWSSAYIIWDMFAFALPVWVLFGVLVIVGADYVWRRGPLFRKVLLGLAPTLLIPPFLYAGIAVWAQTPGFWQRYFHGFHYVSNMWDAASYFANPNKRHYDLADRVADRVFALLPHRAHMFDDDSKGHYPLDLYHRRVLGRRRDVRFHGIFGETLDAEQTRKLAESAKRALERGEPVFFSSAYRPERRVLDELYRLLQWERGTPTLINPTSLTLGQLERSFPQYRLERVYLFPDEPYFIYKFTPRDQDAGNALQEEEEEET